MVLLLTTLLACDLPPEQAIALDLPGQVVREDVSITDDGNVLTIQRHPTPITDGIMFGLVVLLFPGLGLTAGFSLASENRLLALIIVGFIAATDVWMVWSTRHGEVMTIDRREQVVSIRYRLYIGVELPEVRRTFAEVPRIGVGILPGEGKTWIVLELLEADDTRYWMALGDQREDDAMNVAAGLRDHVADAMGIAQVEPTRRRWWW